METAEVLGLILAGGAALVLYDKYKNTGTTAGASANPKEPTGGAKNVLADNSMEVRGSTLYFKIAAKGVVKIYVTSNETDVSQESGNQSGNQQRLVALEQGPTVDKLQLSWLVNPGVTFMFTMVDESGATIGKLTYKSTDNTSKSGGGVNVGNGDAATGSSGGPSGTGASTGSTNTQATSSGASTQPAGTATTTSGTGNSGNPTQGVPVGAVDANGIPLDPVARAYYLSQHPEKIALAGGVAVGGTSSQTKQITDAQTAIKTGAVPAQGISTGTGARIAPMTQAKADALNALLTFAYRFNPPPAGYSPALPRDVLDSMWASITPAGISPTSYWEVADLSKVTNGVVYDFRLIPPNSQPEWARLNAAYFYQ